MTVKTQDLQRVRQGYHLEAGRTYSLNSEAYTDPRCFDVEQKSLFSKNWIWVCHVEKLREPGAYVAMEVAGHPIFLTRDKVGKLRGFYNVCKHRAHPLLSGEGKAKLLTCPYHAWAYDLTGQLVRAPHTEDLPGFDTKEICLDQISVEKFCSFIYVNLDPKAEPLAKQSGDLGKEIMHWAPDIAELTFGHRLTYDIKSNWKNVVDNFLECYHCHTAHKDFVSLVDMDTYKVTTHGIYSRHMAEAGTSENSAYNVSNASVRTHALTSRFVA